MIIKQVILDELNKRVTEVYKYRLKNNQFFIQVLFSMRGVQIIGNNYKPFSTSLFLLKRIKSYPMIAFSWKYLNEIGLTSLLLSSKGILLNH